MKIFYITDIFPALSQTFILREIVELEKSGINIGILSLYDHDKFDPDHGITRKIKTTQYCGVDLECNKFSKGIWHLWALNYNYKGYQKALRLSKTIGLPSMKYLFRNLPSYIVPIKRFGAEHLHAHFGRMGMLTAWLASCVLDLPFSVTLHGSDALVDPYPSIGKVLRDASCVICVSKMIQKKVVADFGVNINQTTVIYNGIDPSEFNLFDASNDELRIVTVARLHPIKGIPDLVSALAVLRKKNIDFHCTIVGDGEDRPKVEKQLHENNLVNRVTLLGSVKNEMIPNILSSHNIFVMPSHSEGLGVAILEALACGLSVVATKVGGIPEIIDNGTNGILVCPQKPKELANAIIYLHKRSKVEKQYTAKTNRHKIENQFHLNLQVNKLIKVFSH